MNEKNTKKQHSAQALDDDALENVAGGYYYDNYDTFSQYSATNRLHFTQKEEDFLISQGIDPREASRSSGEERKAIINKLEKAGFEHNNIHGLGSY